MESLDNLLDVNWKFNMHMTTWKQIAITWTLVVKIGLMHEIFVLQKAWLKSFVLSFLLFCQ